MNQPVSPRHVLGEVVGIDDSLGRRWRRLVIDSKDAHPVLLPHFERAVDEGLLGAFNIGFFFPVHVGEAPEWPVVTGPFVDAIMANPALFHDESVERVTRRKFTVRDGGDDWRLLELNIALLGHGLAMNWAAHARVGDSVVIDLGGRVADAYHLPPVGTYVLLGDETAVPSIATILERLPAGARVLVAIEVTDADDEWALPTAADATIEWIHRGDAEPGTTDFLLDYCAKLDWPVDDVHVWAAAEGLQIRALRAYLRTRMGLQKGQFQLLGYWRRGVTTEQLITVEAEAVNGAAAAGEPLFSRLSQLRPTDQGQDNTTPYENLNPV